jgi:hypothetical protein
MFTRCDSPSLQFEHEYDFTQWHDYVISSSIEGSVSEGMIDLLSEGAGALSPFAAGNSDRTFKSRLFSSSDPVAFE